MLKIIIKEFIKNIITLIISLFCVVTITFVIFEFIPGEMYDLDYIKNENVIQNIREKYQLDKPVYIRYFKTLHNAFTFDFGNSFINEGREVTDIIQTHFPISAKIGIVTILISLFIGLFIGYIMSKINNNKKRDWFIYFFVILSSIPTFVLGAILQYIFCVKLKILPLAQLDDFYSYILPVLILSISPSIFIARLMEQKLRDLNNSDYIIAAKVRGVDRMTLMYNYVLRNSISPVLSYLGPIIANLIVGSFVIESIFNIPGLGKYFITSVINRDYPVVMGLTIFFSVILIISTSVINMIVAIIDYKGDLYGKK